MEGFINMMGLFVPISYMYGAHGEKSYTSPGMRSGICPFLFSVVTY